MNTTDAWPAGKTWVFLGTVGEDATGGTHVCTLTVTPGTGNELLVLYGLIQVGATATAQTAQVIIDDGTNTVSYLLNSLANSATVSGFGYVFPSVASTSALGSTADEQVTGFVCPVSGTMRLRLVVTTAAVSVTQTFAVACRIKGNAPTATLADTVGTPVLTTNTNKVF